MGTVEFEDDFAGAAGSLDGRVRPGGTWSSFGSPIELDGAGHAVAAAAQPRSSYAYVSGMNGSVGAVIGFTAVLNGSSTGQAQVSIESDVSSATVNLAVELENSGADLRINAFGFNFLVARAGRTSVALRLEAEPVGLDMEYRVYVDDVLEYSNTNPSFSLNWASDVFATLQLANYSSTGTAIQFDGVEISRVDQERPSFWTGYVNTYEIP